MDIRQDKRIALEFLWILALLLCAACAAQADQSGSQKNVTMYFFWQIGCPHCQAIDPFIASLEKKYPQLDIQKFEVSKSQENGILFDSVARAYGGVARVTPTVFVGDLMIEGYDGWITEDRIESAVVNCTEKKCTSPRQKLQDYEDNVTSSTTTSTTMPVTTTSMRATTTTSTTWTSTTSSTTSTTTTTTSSTVIRTTTTSAPTTTTMPLAEHNDNTGLLADVLVFLVLSALLVRRFRKPGDLTKKS